MSIATTNPVTNEEVKTFAEMSEEELETALKRAATAFLSWRDTDFDERSRLMHRAAEVLREQREDFARLMTLEMGKVIKAARSEVDKCATVCDYYADHAAQMLADEMVDTEAHRSLIAFEPLGAVLAVMPWNFPFWQVFRFAAPTLMAGNVGLLKHASNVPQCAQAIASVLDDAGFPQGTFQNLPVSAKRVADIIASDYVQAVTVTGSEGAGRKIAQTAGQHLKKSVLELGGSDPFVVLADADVAQAAKVAAEARMLNTGQSCIAAKRFIVEAPVAEAFTAQMKAHLEALRMGDPLEENTDYGPMARQDLAEELFEQMQKSIEMGAKVVCGGRRPDGPGAYFEATLLTDVGPGMPAYEEELFGPVAALIVAQDEADAIRIANDSTFGLGGSVWTGDRARGEAVARRIATGAVFVNSLCRSDPRMPFGGVKRSGYGRELSYFGIREFVNVKSIWVA